MKANSPQIRVDRRVFTVEDADSTVITSHRTREESMDAGELVAEFNPDQAFYIVEHTLN